MMPTWICPDYFTYILDDPAEAFKIKGIQDPYTCN